MKEYTLPTTPILPNPKEKDIELWKEKITQAISKLYTDLTTVIKKMEPFESSEQTITTGGALTIPHGLGAVPRLVQVRLKCTDVAGEAGYVQNDEVVINPSISASTQGLSIVPDSTNLNIRFSSAANVFAVCNKSTGAVTSLTNSKWKTIFRAWL